MQNPKIKNESKTYRQAFDKILAMFPQHQRHLLKEECTNHAIRAARNRLEQRIADDGWLSNKGGGGLTGSMTRLISSYSRLAVSDAHRAFEADGFDNEGYHAARLKEHLLAVAMHCLGDHHSCKSWFCDGAHGVRSAECEETEAVVYESILDPAVADDEDAAASLVTALDDDTSTGESKIDRDQRLDDADAEVASDRRTPWERCGIKPRPKLDQRTKTAVMHAQSYLIEHVTGLLRCQTSNGVENYNGVTVRFNGGKVKNTVQAHKYVLVTHAASMQLNAYRLADSSFEIELQPGWIGRTPCRRAIDLSKRRVEETQNNKARKRTVAVRRKRWQSKSQASAGSKAEKKDYGSGMSSAPQPEDTDCVVLWELCAAWLVHNLSHTQEECDLVARQTAAQGSEGADSETTKAWHANRSRTISASKASKVSRNRVLTARVKMSSSSAGRGKAAKATPDWEPLLKSMLPSTGKKPLSLPATTWGHDHEDEAIDRVEDWLKHVIGPTVSKSLEIMADGSRCTPRAPHYSASVDSLAKFTPPTGKTKGYKAADLGLDHMLMPIEVKCPYAAHTKKLHSIRQYVEWYIGDGEGKKQGCCLERKPSIGTNPEYRLTRSHAYYMQTQMQMFIHGSTSGLFALWVDHNETMSKRELATFQDIHIEVIQFDQGWFDAERVKMDAFYFEVMVLELACPRIPRGLDPKDSTLHCTPQAKKGHTPKIHEWPITLANAKTWHAKSRTEANRQAALEKRRLAADRRGEVRSVIDPSDAAACKRAKPSSPRKGKSRAGKHGKTTPPPAKVYRSGRRREGGHGGGEAGDAGSG
jgi:hypothetical protein